MPRGFVWVVDVADALEEELWVFFNVSGGRDFLLRKGKEVCLKAFTYGGLS